tara:strand:+ start:743 stop:907 length:165 start_codon:yes stop_codon:yes gene_type:complete
MSWDRKAERTERFNKRKKSKNKARTKGYRQSQLREKEDSNDIENWEDELFRNRN